MLYCFDNECFLVSFASRETLSTTRETSTNFILLAKRSRKECCYDKLNSKAKRFYHPCKTFEELRGVWFNQQIYMLILNKYIILLN